MKLYGSLTSPYVRKVRICLIEMGLDYDFIVESPTDPNSNVAHLNPLGKVPLLQRDDGEVLFDSPIIVEYLDNMLGEPLLPVAPERWRVQRWHALADGILDAVVTRLLETRRSAEKQDATLIQRQEGKVAAALRFADEKYGGAQYLEAGQFGIADIAFAVALEYIDFRYSHDWRSSYPRLAEWLSEIRHRESFSETAPPQG
jgi:glutathione S-transferase